MALLVDRLPDDIEALIRQLLELACRHGVTLATAESCTGGLIAALLTDVEGCSHVFERGFVCYTNEAKAEMLDIDPAVIQGDGAVSAAVARAMAQGALAHAQADIALAVTGFAGEAGPGEEAGLVHFACARRGRAIVHRECHFGDGGRAAVRLGTVAVAAAMMIAAIGPEDGSSHPPA